MSNRRRLRPQTTIPSALDSMTGHRMPGGCDDCTAYQTLQQQHAGVYLLTVHHDDTCPAYRGVYLSPQQQPPPAAGPSR